MVTKPEHLVSVEQYAKLCSVTRRNIMDRIRAGTVSHIRIDKDFVIDIVKTPPQKRVRTRKKLNTPPPTKPAGVDVSRLITVKHFAQGKQMRADPIYEFIIADVLDAIMINELIFINADEANDLLKTV